MVGMRPGGGSIRTAAVGRGHDYTRARRDRPARRARERRVLPAAPLVAEGIEGEGEDPAGEGHPGDLGAPAIRDRVGELDTFIGACITITAAGAMMLVGDTAARHGITYDDPAQMANALGSVMGPPVRTLIMLLMINAAVLGTTAISLASSWAYGEVMGWPHSLQKTVREAPGFYGMYIGGVALAAAIVLIPGAPLQLIILGVQVLAGVMLPSAVIFLQLLLNDRDLLGKYANRWWNNVINWTIIAVLFALSVILAVQVIAPNLFPAS
jgi:Mn2+/Fe2+ NRAMP family transporter